MAILFRGSRVKLARALKFIAEVESGLATYNSDNPVSAKWDQSGNEPRLTISWTEVDPFLLAALGDAIHNMRTSLDLMASELARLNNKSDKDVYFPFAASAEEFSAAIKHKKFHLAGDDAVELLMRFAPYKGGNEKSNTTRRAGGMMKAPRGGFRAPPTSVALGVSLPLPGS